MRPAAFALLFFFLPLAARAQAPSADQQRSLGKKMQWLGIAAMVGGAGLAVAGIATGKETSTVTSFSQNGNCTSFTSGSSVATTCFVVAGPGTPSGSSGTSGVISYSQERHATAWKIAAPGIAVAGAGVLLTRVGHTRIKKAELSIRPDGALRLAFKW